MDIFLFIYSILKKYKNKNLKAAKENKFLACYSVKKLHKLTVTSVFYILHAVHLVKYIFLISNKKPCKKPCLSRLNNSVPRLMLTTRVKNSVFIVESDTVVWER